MRRRLCPSTLSAVGLLLVAGAAALVLAEPASTRSVAATAPATSEPAALSTPTPSATSTVDPTAAATTGPSSVVTTATSSPTLTPTPTATPTATPTPTPTATPTQTRPVTSATPGERPGSPAAVEESDISLTTGALAVASLIIAGAALLVAHSVDRTQAAGDGVPPPARTSPSEPAVTVPLLVELGEGMIDSGYTVTQVQATLGRVLQVNGVPGGQVIVLPTALFVSVPGQTTMETAVAAAGVSGLRLDQVDAVSRVVTAAEAAELTPAEARAALARARAQSPPFSATTRTLGYALLSTGLALILRGGAVDVVVAAGLGAGVGALQLWAQRSSAASRAVLPVLCSFLVAVSVLALGRLHEDVGVLAPLVAPLVIFLPGALLTTAVIELSTGQMVSGAGRLASGLLQLVMLALGIVAGANLVGIPARSIRPPAAGPLGDFAPWVGVALFGTGVLVYYCARASTIGWIILVLYVAYGAQIIGGLVLGPILSAFFGALVMSPVASYVALRPSGPPMQVSFLPAFWLLVPGALGLVGVTQLLGANRADSVASLVSMGTTMIGISFGVLIGLALGTTLVRQLGQPRPVAAG